MAKTNDIRNIVLVGHGGCGKTSIAEAVLHSTDKTNRLGSVDEKTSVSDYYEEEKQHSHSISTATMYTDFDGKLVNVIDTPGFPDFVGRAIQAMPAAETAVVVISASAGIETNTRKLFNIAKDRNQPRVIVVNKIDSDNIDIPELIKQIQETFGSECRCANLPSADNKSVIDCVVNTTGDSPVKDVAEAHTELIESVIEADDALMEKYLGGEEISTEQVSTVFVEAIKTGTVIPIVFTDAKNEVGIKELLELITNFTPSPTQTDPAVLKLGDETTEIKADPDGPFAAMVFRVAFDPRSNMKYSTMRIFSGTLKSDTNLYVDDMKKPVRPGHIMKMQGGEHDEIEAGVAGDIVTLAKVEELQNGCLAHDGNVEGYWTMPKLPDPMFSLALEPASRGDEQKIGSALDKITSEDPCFKVIHDPQTKELVISGMGELHLRVMLEKMENYYKLNVNTKQPKIPYKETISAKAEGHYRHKKQTGGAGQFGEVYLRIEPAERNSDPGLIFTWDIFGGSIPRQFEAPVLKGVEDVMASGAVAGFPMQDIKVSVYDGKYHPVDSKEVAFRAAGKGAFIDAIQKAKPVLLEPIVEMEITVPAENMGDIAGDLSSKRGRVLGQEMLAGDMLIIKAQVPLSEVTQYSSQLKSVTGGQGSYSMAMSHYEAVPPNVQQQVVAAHKKEQEQEE